MITNVQVTRVDSKGLIMVLILDKSIVGAEGHILNLFLKETQSLNLSHGNIFYLVNPKVDRASWSLDADEILNEKEYETKINGE